jgi:L-fucose mutarotase
MLRTPLLHPQIAEALGRAGHGSKVLITDANYPASTKLGSNARLVHLNLAPGLVTVTDVLRVLVAAIPVEAAEVMTPDDGPEPEIFAEFRALLADSTTFDRSEVELTKHGRFPFYDIAAADDIALTIQTGEERIYANLLLTVGVVTAQQKS